MNDFLKLSIIFEKLAQQMALPGIEPGIERSKEQFPFEKNVEKNIENEYREQKRKWISEPGTEKGYQEGLVFDPLGEWGSWPQFYGKSPYERMDYKDSYPSDFIIPTPGNFLPDANINNIYQIIDTKTSYKKHIENVIASAKKPMDQEMLDTINGIYTTESVKYPTDEDALELYDDVKTKYNEFYRYFLILQKDYEEYRKAIPKSIEADSIKEVFDEAINYSLKTMKKNLALRFFEEFRNDEIFKNKKEATKVRIFKDFQYSLDEKIKAFKIFNELQTNGAAKMKEKFDQYLANPENKAKLEAIQNNDIVKSNIFDHVWSFITNRGYRDFDFNKMDEIIESLINSSIVYPLEGAYREEATPYADKVTAKILERVKKLGQDFLIQIKDESPERVEQELSKYFDIAKLKRMANFGLFGPKDSVNKSLESLPRMLQNFNYEDLDLKLWRFGKVGNELYSKKYSPEQLNEVIDKEAHKALKQIFSEVIEDLLSNIGVSVPIQNITQTLGDFGIKDIIDHYGKSIGNKDFFGKFVGAILKRPEATQGRNPYSHLHGSFLSHYKFDEKLKFIYDIYNKFKTQDMDKLIDIFNDRSIDSELDKIDNNLTSSYDEDNGNQKDLLTKDEIHNLLFESLKSFNSIKKDISNFSQVAREVHNYGAQVDAETLKKIIKNPNMSQINLDIVKKFNSLIVKVAAQGGLESFLNKYKEEIGKTQNRNLVGRDFQDRLKMVFELFDSSVKINPSSPEFNKIKNLINKTNSDIETITSLKEFEKYYDKAEKVQKAPELFNLNMDISPNVRFRVLRDLDPQYFTVGNETDCCQTPGGAGEEAMIDSFINPLAGVVVLEHNTGGDWKTAAQSYFHYVPDDNGFILDNIEVAPRYETINNIPVEDFYAYWANEKIKELNLKYFQSGKQYSGISPQKFEAIDMEEDPRSFAVSYPYTDWNPNAYNIDLSKPHFEYNQAVKTAMFRNIFKMALMFDRLIRKG